MIIVKLPRPISVNNLFANFQGRRIASKRYVEWRKKADAMVIEQAPGATDRPSAITLKVGITGTRSNSDTDNVSKAYLDCLVRLGIIPDDSRYYIPRLVIEWCDDLDGCRAIIEPIEEQT